MAELVKININMLKGLTGILIFGLSWFISWKLIISEIVYKLFLAWGETNKREKEVD